MMARETVKIEGLEGVLKTLNELPAEVASKNGGPVRFALRKAAQVIQKQIKANLQQIILEPNADGSPNESTGFLDKNIVISRGKQSSIKGERMVVRVRNKAYPQKGRAKKVTTAQVARLLEYGTEKRQPYPFIRPAFDQKKNEALTTFSVEINKKLASIIKKLERHNRVKI